MDYTKTEGRSGTLLPFLLTELKSTIYPFPVSVGMTTVRLRLSLFLSFREVRKFNLPTREINVNQPTNQLTNQPKLRL